MSIESNTDLTVPEIKANIHARNYWSTRLKDFKLVPWFRSGYEADTRENGKIYAVHTTLVPETIYSELNVMAPADVSKHILLLSCLAILMQRHSLASDIAIFTPPFNDSGDKSPHNDGNIVPVRISDFVEKKFHDFLMRLKFNVMGDLSFSDYPLEKILGTDQEKLAALPVVGMVVSQIQQESMFNSLPPDILFSFSLRDPVSLTIRFDTNRYPTAYIAAISGQYFALLQNILNNKEGNIDEMEIVTGPARQQVIAAVKDFAGNDSIGEKYIPASWHQERLWFIDKFEAGYLYKEGPVYHNIPLLFDLSGCCDPVLLRESLVLLAGRHEALRTLIINGEQGLLQKIVPAGALWFTFRYLEADPAEADVLAENEYTVPFKLDQPLFRAMLLKTGSERFKLVLTIHHIIADRYSTRLLANELFLLYRMLLNGEQGPVQKPPVPYGGFSLWQQQALPGLELNMLSYWKLHLGAGLKILKLPTDQARAAVHTYMAGSVDLSIPEELLRKLLHYDNTVQVGCAVILMAAFKILLHKYARQEEIVIGTAVDNRHHEMLRHTAGPVENLIVIRSFINDDMSFNVYVKALSRIYTTGVRYGMMPFDKLVKEIAPEKDMSRTALFDVLFRYSDDTIDLPVIEDLAISTTDTNLGYGKYDLNMFLEKTSDGLQGKLVYNAGYYHASTITAMAAHYVQLLQNLLSSPEHKLSLMGMLPEQEKNSLLDEFNFTGVRYPDNKTLADLFTDQVRRTPGNIAVKYGDESVTYEQLDQLSNELAFRLRKNGVWPGTIVALLVDRSIHTITGILAILKSGGAYLPIDSDYPDDRIAYYLHDSGTEIIVTTSEYRHKAGSRCTIVLADEPDGQPGTQVALSGSLQPGDLCYIIYTSGTTGNPKGVMIEHRNVVRLFFNDDFPFRFGSQDVWTMFHSHCFDFSVWEIFGALLFGGKLIIIPKIVARDTAAFWEILKTEGVSVLNQTPASFYNLAREEMQHPDALLNLRYVIFGGEALAPGKLKHWKHKYPATRLINMFGITETTVHVTWKEIGEQEISNNISNIGRPIPTLSVYILDENRQPVPKGAVGELYVGGAGVARGYLGNSKLTESKFIINPFHPGEKIYRSGDLVKRLISGDLEYVGRVDHQVQLRGFRIELGEIENHLAMHDRIKDAVVMAREKSGDKYLAAYYVADEEIKSAELRGFLLDRLPDYMVPAYFTYLEKMPLTQNGKLDRDALPEPVMKPKEEHLAPTNEVEEMLAGIWAEVLDIDKSLISINSNFFDIGGHSLLAPILVNMISRKLDYRFHLKILYQYPTIAAFADYYFKNMPAGSHQ